MASNRKEKVKGKKNEDLRSFIEALDKLGLNRSKMMYDMTMTPLREIDKIGEEISLEEHLMLHMAGGIVDDPYGDGDQTQLSGREAHILKSRWATGADYNPFENLLLSQWVRDCYNGNLQAVKKRLDENPLLLEKRESVLRLCGIFHVIGGARTIDPSEDIPDDVCARVTADSDHQACAKLLLERGARVEARDFAGHTPLFHCTGMFANDLSLKIAKLLLEYGADVNARNRMGATPLFEATMSSKFNAVDFLLNNGARVDVKDNDDVLLFTLGSYFPKMAARFSVAAARQAANDQKAAQESGSYAVCAVCKSFEAKRCTGCFMMWYCGPQCQRDDWPNHKGQCKAIKKRFKSVPLYVPAHGALINYIDKKFKRMGTSDESTKVLPSPPIKTPFIVKVQAPLALVAQIKRGEKKKSDSLLLVYNEDRSINGYIEGKSDLFDELLDTIINRGSLGGVKAYFVAMLDENKTLKINAEDVQMPQAW